MSSYIQFHKKNASFETRNIIQLINYQNRPRTIILFEQVYYVILNYASLTYIMEYGSL